MTRSRQDRAAPLLEFVGVFAGTDLMTEIARRGGRTRAERRRQAQLPLPKGPREATDAELRDLLGRLPMLVERITNRRDKRAQRTAHRRRWVHEDAGKLHLTADGRSALAELGGPTRGGVRA